MTHSRFELACGLLFPCGVNHLGILLAGLLLLGLIVAALRPGERNERERQGMLSTPAHVERQLQETTQLLDRTRRSALGENLPDDPRRRLDAPEAPRARTDR